MRPLLIFGMKNKLRTTTLLASLSIIAYGIYLPGLSGGFLFDDYGNLPALGAYGPVDDAQTLLRYVTSGKADPTGRPVAMASFLIDARDWPAKPYSFKHTNLVLHIINGLLLVLLLFWLARERLQSSHATWAAFVGAGLWLLHPLFVSTTLYIIQRQAMLAALFVILGLLGYVSGRQKIIKGHPLLGCLLASTSILSCTILATLSKANGALLPVFALVLEYTVLSKPESAAATKNINRLRFIMLGLPCLAVLFFLFSRIPPDISVLPAGRPWSFAERLLTQPRIVMDYLRLLWFPRPFTTGVFNDHVHHSTDLLTPWTTLPSIAGILLLTTFGLAAKHRFPLLAAAILFFITGHLLESTIIPLELYYEHRNYLPSIILFLPLSAWLTSKDNYTKAKYLLTVILLVGLATMTYLRVDLWGNTEEQALLWAQINPNSPRAQAYAAQFEMKQNQHLAAIKRLNTAITKFPDEPQLGINLLAANCKLGKVTDEQLKLAEQSLENTITGTTLLYKWLLGSIPLAKSGKCTNFDLNALSRMVDAASRNPDISNFKGRRQDLLHIKGRLAIAQGDKDKAFRLFEKSMQEFPRIKVGLAQAAALAQAGHLCIALQHLRHLDALTDTPANIGLNMQSIHAWLLGKQGYWLNEITTLRKTLIEDIEALGHNRPSDCLNAISRERAT